MGAVTFGAGIGLASCAPAKPVAEPPPRALGSSSTQAVPEIASPGSPPGWNELAPPFVKGRLLLGAAFFADDSAIWRCVAERCERFDLLGKPARQLRLPCAVRAVTFQSNLVASPSGTVVAMRCGAELVRLRSDGSLMGRSQASLDSEHMVVDDDGAVTTSIDRGQDRWTIARQRGEGAPESVEVSSKSQVEPGIGVLLAWTNGNSGSELAWVGGAPPKPVPFSGLALVNGEHLWISFSKGGYARLEGTSLTPVSGAPKGGLPPHGILMSSAPWGRKGMLFFYERAVVLVNEELEAVHQVELPRISLSLAYDDERLVTDRVSEVLASPSGNTLFARLADGSVMAWGPIR